MLEVLLLRKEKQSISLRERKIISVRRQKSLIWEPSIGTSHRLPKSVSKQQLNKPEVDDIPAVKLNEPAANPKQEPLARIKDSLQAHLVFILNSLNTCASRHEKV
jgi:hypothetical protein